MTFNISWHFTFEISCHFTFHVVWRFMLFGVSYHLAFHVIWHFMSFGVSYHLAFHVMWRFMSFGVSCHLAFHVISVINGHSNLSHQRHHGINAKVVIEDRCVLKKWRIVTGRYCYKSSFGANKQSCFENCIPVSYEISLTWYSTFMFPLEEAITW